MASHAATTQDDLRRLNLARLIRRLHEAGSSSRSDLVAFSGLNRSTVGVLVSELAEVGLVAERAGSAGQVGRPSLRVEAVPGSAVVVAFDLRVDRTIVALVGLGGEVLFRREQKHRRVNYTPQSAVRTVVTLTELALAKAPEGASWVGLGIGVPGVVDHVNGRVRVAPNLGWVDVPFGESVQEALAERFGTVPSLTINNDADLGAIAEHVRGAGVHARNLIFLSGDVGIGGGVVIDDRLMTGASGFGGEVGHMVVNPAGRTCRCGATGCWETEIGHDAIVGSSDSTGSPGEVADVVRAAADGDPDAQAALQSVGEWLGIGLANLVNVFNPEVIVLGGHLRLVFPTVSGIVLRRIHFALPAAREQVRIEVPAMNGDSTLIGAAETAFDALLSDPIGVLSRAPLAVAS